MNPRENLITLAIRYSGEIRKLIDAITKKEMATDAEYEHYMRHMKCNVLTILDDAYPEYLKHVYLPPLVLFYYGDISLLNNRDKNLAIVGAREASQSGLRNVYDLTEQVASKYNIVSGLAMGVDAAAHRACIEAGGKTIAVLGCGIEQCYPSINRSLYEEIKANHLLISEYYNYIPPYAENFHQRNRLIAGFSKGLLLGESRIHSGSQITLSFAESMNLNLMAIPSSEMENSLCNQVIRSGCPVVLCAQDIIDNMD